MSVLSRLGVAARLLPPFPKPFSRNYGSAAAAQLDYDSYYCYDDDDKSEKTNQREIEDSDGWETLGRGVQWVIMGDPMARRHLYAQRLANLLQVPHISMGSLVRQELNPDSPLYKKIASAVNQGKLVPEDVIFGLLSKRLEEGYCRGETGFILDGIPRTRMQAEILDQIADIDLVLNLKCAEESLVKKTLGGGMYSPSREFHSLATSGFNLGIQKQPGPFQSTNADSPFQSTNADSDTVWKEKLRMYAEQMKPLEEYYKQQHKLLDYQVVGAPGDTWQGLLAALQLQHVNVVTSPVNTSQKLTA